MVNDMGNDVVMNETNKNRSNELHHKGDESHLVREIVRTNQVLMNGFSRMVGMSMSRLTLMRLLATADEGVGVNDLARHLGINAAAVTRQVKEMEDEGLIQRRDDPTDGRRSYVNLSPKGHMLFEEVHERSHELERALSKVISEEEIAATTAVLGTLRNFVESYLSKGEPK